MVIRAWPIIAGFEGGEDLSGVQAASRKERLLADSQPENEDLWPTAARNWVRPATGMSLEANPSLESLDKGLAWPRPLISISEMLKRELS